MTDVPTDVPGDLAGFLAAYRRSTASTRRPAPRWPRPPRVDDYAAGELVLDAFATASVDVHVVVSGRVELWDDQSRLGGAPDEVLGPGGVFGFSAMLTERSIGPKAVAAVRSTVARIPETAALPVFTSRQGARYLAERLAAIPVRAEVGPTYSTVDEPGPERAAGRWSGRVGLRGLAVPDRRGGSVMRWWTSAATATGSSPTPLCADGFSPKGFPRRPPCGR